MVLEPDLRSRLNRILKEQKHIGKLKAHGLNPRQKLLLTGPPGCGKTMTASALAGELGTPLFIVRLDGLITKFMGETTAKLRLIFDAIEDTRAVYLFDEFDSIGTQRSFLNEVGEIRRVLNSFLMFIEEHKSNSLLIAATNHPQNLDFALFRRFDDLLEYGLPDKKMIVDMLEARLSEYKSANFDFERIAELASGLSFADLTRACEEAAKEMIISDRTQLATEDVLRSISDRFSFREKDRP
jgi:SpoVK/Ycf46/Vps4 family AAA+-type ATPase